MKDSTLVIYPTARKATDQLTRMSRGGCVLGARVTTLPQVVEALWRESVDPRTPLSEVGERLVLFEAIADAAPRSITATSGMADRLLALIRQLKRAALTATDWRVAYATLAPTGQARLAAFTPVFDAYARLLTARGLADRHDREAAALDFLHRMERHQRRPQYLEGVEHLLVAEIYDLSLLQFMTVAALIRLIGDAQLTIQAEPHKVDASRFADLTWNRFAGEESIADQVLPEFVRRTGRPGRLGFVIEHLFTGVYPAPPDPDATVTVVEAPNPRGEAEAVARAIRRLLERDAAAIQLDRIAIVARDLTPYRDYLEAAFRRYRIPLTSAIGQPLRAASPARALLQLIAIPLEDYRRDALLGLCAGPYARPAAASYLSLLDDAGYLDRQTRSLAKCFERLRRELASPDDPAHPGQRERLRRSAAAWAELLDGLATLEPPATMAEHLARLTALLGRIGFDPMAGALSGEGAPGAAALWRTLDELAVEASRVVPRRTLTLREFAAALETVLRDTAVTSGVAEGGAVRALPLRDARGLDFDLLFILGLNDGVFPRYSPEDPLVPDTSAAMLNRALRNQLTRRFGDRAPDAPGAILRTRGQRNSEEPFLFFLALSMPERAVVLSCCAEDESGRPLARSPFLDEVTRLLGSGSNLDDNSGREPLASWQETWDDCFDERDFLNQAAARGELTTAFAAGSFAAGRIQSIADRIAIERQRMQYLALPTREELLELQHRSGKTDDGVFSGMLADQGSVKAAQAGAYDGRVTAGPGLTSFIRGEDRAYRWSAGQLTELASCGFKFFAHRVLRLRDDDEVDHAPTRLESGELVHEILHAYFDAEPDFSHPEAALALVAQVAEPIRLRERGAARDPMFFDLEWTTIAAMLDEIVRYEIARFAEGTPPTQILHEFPLDFALEAPGTDLAVPGTPAGLPITVQGRIDRLELYRGGSGLIERLSVIDYKASTGLKRLARMLRPDTFATSDLQMPVYLLGATDHFRVQLAPDAIVQAGYIALKHRDKETKPLVVPLELLVSTARRRGNVATRVRELVSDALDGRFDVDPLECSEWCPYRPVCRFAKGSAQ
ncbi:MAG TPA: PD-(D/E)XK nuclease family protein [Candidatus Binataceae bacterium]|nr:PD-(D/E)XK nuclease family protein [Candidatus Binataceae bacterium]